MTVQSHVLANPYLQQLHAGAAAKPQPTRPDTATIEWIEWRVEELARERAAGAIEYDSWRAHNA